MRSKKDQLQIDFGARSVPVEKTSHLNAENVISITKKVKAKEVKTNEKIYQQIANRAKHLA